MMNYSHLSDHDIQQAIAKMQKGVEIKPDSAESAELQTSIDRALEELKRRAQKKSQSQSIEKPGQLPQKPELEAWAMQIEREAKNQVADQEQSVKAFETRVSVGRASEIVVTIPVAEVKIGDSVRQLTQTEIVTLLKTYFKRVATSERMKNGQYTAAYASEMGKTVWRLFDGWNLIYQETKEGSEWPPMVDIFPGWKNAQQAHKVTADVLWRWASNRK